MEVKSENEETPVKEPEEKGQQGSIDLRLYPYFHLVSFGWASAAQ